MQSTKINLNTINNFNQKHQIIQSMRTFSRWLRSLITKIHFLNKNFGSPSRFFSTYILFGQTPAVQLPPLKTQIPTANNIDQNHRNLAIGNRSIIYLPIERSTDFLTLLIYRRTRTKALLLFISHRPTVTWKSAELESIIIDVPIERWI